MFSSISGQFPDEYDGIGAEIISPAPSQISMGGAQVPRVVIQLILRHLSPDELFKACRVCKLFNEVASSNPLWNSYDLREVFPKATFIDREVWQTHIDVEKYGIELEQKGRPCVDKTDYVELKRMESQVEGGRGITIMTLPKGDKLSNVQESAANPKAGNPVIFQYFSPYILEQLGEVETETVTVVMTNGVFIDSRNKSVKERKQIVEDLKCEVPGILAATRLGVMRFCMSPPEAPVRLFSDNPKLTYTLCVDEKKDETAGEVVEVISRFGSFAPAGPRVSRGVDVGKSRGVTGLRKFKVLGP